MNYIKLLRPKHYIKNVIILLPLFFSGQFLVWEKLLFGLLGIIVFSMLSSSIYIFNDLNDVEKDRLHPQKCNRPIASGAVKKPVAVIIMIGLLIMTGIISLLLFNMNSVIYLSVYYILNILYSVRLKCVPILDVAILASGFLIRVLFGGCLLDIEVSEWLYLMILSGALYMGLGKRRNELILGTGSRSVLKKYSKDFLNQNMNVCMGLAMVFYSLWAKDSIHKSMIWTIPLFIIIIMRYGYSSECDKGGDLVEIILHDVLLLLLLVIYIGTIAVILYL